MNKLSKIILDIKDYAESQLEINGISCGTCIYDKKIKHQACLYCNNVTLDRWHPRDVRLYNKLIK